MAIKDQINRIKDAKASIKEVVNQDFNKIGNQQIDAYPDLIAKTAATYKTYVPWKKETGTDILTFDNDKDYKVREMIIDGNSRQKTTNGINMLDITLTSGSKSGISWIVNEDKSIILNGTATENFNLVMTPNREFEPGTYTICDFHMYTQKINGEAIGWKGNGNGDRHGQIATFTIDEAWKTTTIGSWITTGTTYNNEILKPMMLKGSYTKDNLPDYEPYTGNQPSPNLDYPQDIEVLEGWNLFNLENVIGYDNNGIKTTFKDGKLHINGVATNDTYLVVYENTEGKRLILDKGDYSFQRNSTELLLTVALKGTQSKILDANDTFTFNEGDYIFSNIFIPKDKVCNDIVIYPQLHKGLDKKPYIPYGCVEIKRNSWNFFNKDNITNNRFMEETGAILSNPNWNMSLENIGVEPNIEYTFSRDKSEIAESQFLIAEYKANGDFIKRNILWQTGTYKYTITTTSETKYVHLGYRNDFKHTDLMFQKGNDRTSYEPYQEQITYINLQGNKVLSDDKIIVDRKGNVKLIKKWGNDILVTNDNWQTVTERPLYYEFYGFITRLENINNVCLSKYINNTDDNRIYIGNKNVWWRIPKTSNISTIQELRDFLTNTDGVEIYYPLETPQIIDLGKIDLSLLENINNIEILATIEPSKTDLIAESEEIYTSWTQSSLYNK